MDKNNKENLSFNIWILAEGIVRQWQMIVSLILVVSLIAGFISYMLPKYTAQAIVASIKTTSTVSFGSSIELTTEEQMAARSLYDPTAFYDRAARMQSYVSLVKNVAIAQVVLEQLGSRFDQEITISKLLDMVTGDLITDAELIEISVSYKDPVLAAEVANAWAEAYVYNINLMYGSDTNTQSYQSVKVQAVQAKTDYDTAQAVLVNFVANSNIDKYTRQINDLRILIDSLSSARNTAMTILIQEQTGKEQTIIKDLFAAQAQNQLLALQQDQALRRELIIAYMDALRQARNKVFNEDINDRMVELERYYIERRQTRAFLTDAKLMQSAIKQGGDAAAQSDALALMLLKTQVYASYQGTNNLQLQYLPEAFGAVTFMDAAGMIKDISALIDTLTAWEKDLDQKIDALSKELQNGEGLRYIDLPISGGTGDLAATIQKNYPELFQKGELSSLSLDAAGQSNPLETEAVSRSQELLELKGLEGILSFDISQMPIEVQIQEFEQQVSNLQANIALEESNKRELERGRDLAWETYRSLATKEAELSVAKETPGVEVTLASPAAVPEEDDRSTLGNMVIAMVVSGFLGIIFAMVYELWQLYRGVQPRAIFEFAMIGQLLGRRKSHR